MDHVWIIIGRSLYIRGDFHDRWLAQHNSLRPYAANSAFICTIVVQEIAVGKFLIVELLTSLRDFREVILLKERVCGRVPDSMLGPYTLTKLPTGISLPTILAIIMFGW
jgi:hypothetical protein